MAGDDRSYVGASTWTLFGALGPAKENNYALESLNGHKMPGRRELKRKS